MARETMVSHILSAFVIIKGVARIHQFLGYRVITFFSKGCFSFHPLVIGSNVFERAAEY